jgi:hypothetical protein
LHRYFVVGEAWQRDGSGVAEAARPTDSRTEHERRHEDQKSLKHGSETGCAYWWSVKEV